MACEVEVAEASEVVDNHRVEVDSLALLSCQGAHRDLSVGSHLFKAS